MWIGVGSLCALVQSGCAASDDAAGAGSSTSTSAAEPSSSSASSSSSETGSSSDGGPSICEGEGWGDSGEEGADDTSFGMGDDMPLPFTIPEVQHGDAQHGARVAISGAIVVTPSAPSEALGGRELFVQDPLGGPYSGLRVVAGGLDLGQLLVPGDEVDLVGEIVEHQGFYALQIAAPSDVTVLGPTALPEPTLVGIDELAADSPTAREYEGVVVQIVDATVTDSAPCTGELVLDDTVRVDDRFVPGLLAAMGEGALVSTVRGVFVTASGSYELAPPEPGALQ